MAKESYADQVANEIIRQLKEGTSIFQQPWKEGVNSPFPQNAVSGKNYKGINRIYLQTIQRAMGYSDPRWLTYKQATELGAQVRKGEHGKTIEFWKYTETVNKKDERGNNVLDKNGKPVKVTYKLERPKVFYARVFNADQIDNMPPMPPRKEQQWQDVERAERILKNSGAVIRHDVPDQAFYQPRNDFINLPDKAAFEDSASYYGTALHELGHWTGHKDRLNRDLQNPFGSEGYAREELRAEISSMIVGDELGLGFDPGNHVAYVDNWIKALEDDPREIFRAAADAEKIQQYVLGFSLEREQNQEQNLENSMELQQPTQQTDKKSILNELENSYGWNIAVDADDQGNDIEIPQRWFPGVEKTYMTGGTTLEMKLNEEAGKAEIVREYDQEVLKTIEFNPRDNAAGIAAQLTQETFKLADSIREENGLEKMFNSMPNSTDEMPAWFDAEIKDKSLLSPTDKKSQAIIETLVKAHGWEYTHDDDKWKVQKQFDGINKTPDNQSAGNLIVIEGGLVNAHDNFIEGFTGGDPEYSVIADAFEPTDTVENFAAKINDEVNKYADDVRLSRGMDAVYSVTQQDKPQEQERSVGQIASELYPDTFPTPDRVSTVYDELTLMRDRGVSFDLTEEEEAEDQELSKNDLVRIYSVDKQDPSSPDFNTFTDGEPISLNKRQIEADAQKQGLSVKSKIVPENDVLMEKFSEEKGLYSPKTQAIYLAQNQVLKVDEISHEELDTEKNSVFQKLKNDAQQTVEHASIKVELNHDGFLGEVLDKKIIQPSPGTGEQPESIKESMAGNVQAALYEGNKDVNLPFDTYIARMQDEWVKQGNQYSDFPMQSAQEVLEAQYILSSEPIYSELLKENDRDNKIVDSVVERSEKNLAARKAEIATQLYPDTFPTPDHVSTVYSELNLMRDRGVSFDLTAEEEAEDRALGENDLIRVYGVSDKDPDSLGFNNFSDGEPISLNKRQIEREAQEKGLNVKSKIVPDENVLMENFSEEKGLYSPKTQAMFLAQSYRLNKALENTDVQKIAKEKTYINVPYSEKEDAKKLGARWDRKQQSWYIPVGKEIGQFDKWKTQNLAAKGEKIEGKQRLEYLFTAGKGAIGESVDTQVFKNMDNENIVVLGTYTQDKGKLFENKSMTFKSIEEFNKFNDGIKNSIKANNEHESMLGTYWRDALSENGNKVSAENLVFNDFKAENLQQTTQQAVKKDVPAKNLNEKTFLAVPYSEKEDAKKLGARWDRKNKSWYIQGDVPKAAAKWLPQLVKNEQMPSMRPDEEFADAMRANGLIVNGPHPIMDGEKHRIACEGDKKGEKSGFYVGYLDGHPAGFIANNRTSQEQKWKATGVQLSEEEKAKIKAEAAQKLAAREEEAKILAAKVSQKVGDEKTTLQSQHLDNQSTPYLANKGIEGKKDVYALKDGGTFIPLYNAKGEITTAQTIRKDGTKSFTPNGVKTGSFHVVDGIENLNKGDTIVIAEGYATAASLQQSMPTRAAVVAAFDCHNLEKVGQELREQYPDKRIIFAADNDEARLLSHGENPGLDAAQRAAAKVGGEVIKPSFAGHKELIEEIKNEVTPEKWKAHCRAKAALENPRLTEKQKQDAKNSLIDEKVIKKYNELKADTDFNDLYKKDYGKRQIAAKTDFQLAGKQMEQKREMVKKYERNNEHKKAMARH